MALQRENAKMLTAHVARSAAPEAEDEDEVIILTEAP